MRRTTAIVLACAALAPLVLPRLMLSGGSGDTGAEGVRVVYDLEALTLAPIDRRLVLPGMLSLEELDWLDTYHARVRAEISSLVHGEARDWLIAATEPMMRIA